MTTSTRELAAGAPRTGPWIIGYVASLGAVFAVTGSGAVSEPRVAVLFWIPIAVCTAMIVYTSWRRHRLLGTASEAVRRFWRRFVTAAAFMFAGYCVLAYGQMVGGWGANAQRVALAVPLAGFAGMVWAVHRYPLDEKDEYLRSLALRQLGIASFTALSAAIAWSAVSLLAGVEAADIGLIVLLWFAGLGIGRLVNEMRP